MAALGAQSIASSYEQLLHCDRNLGGNGTTHVSVKDGDNGTTFGFTIASDALMMSSTNRLEFGDTGTYINQSGDGILNITSDTEVEINATAVDLNGTLDVSGNAQLSGTVTVGADGSGTDVIFYSGTAGDNFTWDASEEKLTITGTDGQTALDIADGNLVVADDVDIEGDIDVNGTANLDNTDIDGTLDVSGTLTVGDDAGIGGNVASQFTITSTSGGGDSRINFADDSGTDGVIQYHHTNREIRIKTAGSVTRMTIDSSGNVGIGETTPAALLHLKHSSGTAILTLENTGGAGAGTDWNIFSHTDGYLYFLDGATSRLELTAAGDVSISGDLKMADGKGIDFSAMTSPADATGMAAEILKDYEEGTYQPTVTCDSGGYNTASYTYFRYTKTGRVVFVQGHLQIGSEDGTPSGNLRISLPFTIADDTELSGRAYGTAFIFLHGGTHAGRMYAAGIEGNSYFGIVMQADDGLETTVDHDDVDTNFSIHVGFTYTT